jgi:pimeloyl-ACP methyl ester carboxylesterase/DNA-binding CsgD family transcriptional regulator
MWSSAMPAETRYARSGDVNIAYQVIGEGSFDLVFVMGWVSHLDYFWAEPSFARFLGRLASFSRLILFDKRGTGLSDRVAELPALEQRMDDVRAVLDAVGSQRAALLGVSEGGSLCALFAATHPERATALVTIGSFARRLWAPDYPLGVHLGDRLAQLEQLERGWGSPVLLARRAPSVATDERFRHWWGTYLRMSASPGSATALTRMNMAIDIRQVLSAIRVPTLVIHRSGDLTIPVEAGRYLAERIPDARYVELPGADHLPFVGDQGAILDEVERFLGGVRPAAVPDRVLATVLVAAVAGSSATVVRPGDDTWRGTLDAFAALIGPDLAQFRGRGGPITGGRLVATFDGPARAIRCACAIVDGARRLGIDVRAGLHAGECDLAGEEAGGLAVQIAAQVLTCAESGAVVVSSTVKDLVVGSGIAFRELGTHRFKGVPGAWQLSLVTPGATPAIIALPMPEPAKESHPGPLTRREREVATLIALGLTNRQIAEDLVIAEATAERHVANILNKLGCHSRAQVAAWAVESGLLRARTG